MEKLQMLNDHIGHSIDQTKTFSNVIDEKVNLFIEQTLKSVEMYNERLVESLDQHSITNIFDKIYADMDKVHANQEERVDKIYENITNYHERYEAQTQSSVKAFQNSITDSEKWISEFNDSIPTIMNVTRHRRNPRSKLFKIRSQTVKNGSVSLMTLWENRQEALPTPTPKCVKSFTILMILCVVFLNCLLK
jgi:hypothetical protein